MMPVGDGHRLLRALREHVHDGMEKHDADGDCPGIACYLLPALRLDEIAGAREVGHAEDVRAQTFGQRFYAVVELHNAWFRLLLFDGLGGIRTRGLRLAKAAIYH